MNPDTRIHGGPDATGAARFDFSTNSNACGPCPMVLAAVQAADATRYPDASYTDLRSALAAHHRVARWRVVLAASASEFIFRITAAVRRLGGTQVFVPRYAYGDYAAAAQAWDLVPAANPDAADLVWACDPASPTGQTCTDWPRRMDSGVVVLDSAYAPLRLSGEPALSAQQRDAVWQLFSPNKALGLTGVRAAYAIAPHHAADMAAQLERLAPSWAVGAHGVAMLNAWVHVETQAWIGQSLDTLREWKRHQIDALEALAWTVMPSHANFFCARPPDGVELQPLLDSLRKHGVKLRDASSLGLPGWARLGVLGPLASDVLQASLSTGD